MPQDQRKRINRPTAMSGKVVAPVTVNTVPAHRVEDPSPSQHSAKKVRKAIDFTVAVEGLDEMGNKVAETDGEKVGENEIPAISMIPDPTLQEEGEDGEIWWNEVIQEEEAEKNEEELVEQVETGDNNDMLVDGNDNEANQMDVERFVEVEAKEVGKGKQEMEKKTGVRKKVTRATLGVGGGPLRRLVHGAKTPKRKVVVKEHHRGGEKIAGKEMEPAGNPSDGSETSKTIG
ncbi:unnamed protein product [Microthlaspi erraticum]|uniref:Uncharacterized protein n=1 Tax=Microthlaspi erraticum TaxID=1685480 RepID=A0A6D2K1F2_9BRAS|nr:unnamed protein product [Microthlaspi erraticum]